MQRTHACRVVPEQLPRRGHAVDANNKGTSRAMRVYLSAFSEADCTPDWLYAQIKYIGRILSINFLRYLQEGEWLPGIFLEAALWEPAAVCSAFALVFRLSRPEECGRDEMENSELPDLQLYCYPPAYMNCSAVACTRKKTRHDGSRCRKRLK